MKQLIESLTTLFVAASQTLSAAAIPTEDVSVCKGKKKDERKEVANFEFPPNNLNLAQAVAYFLSQPSIDGETEALVAEHSLEDLTSDDENVVRLAVTASIAAIVESAITHHRERISTKLRNRAGAKGKQTLNALGRALKLIQSGGLDDATIAKLRAQGYDNDAIESLTAMAALSAPSQASES